MDWSPDDETDKMLWHMAIQNAIEYSGKAAAGSVIGRLMAARTDLRPYGKTLSPLIAQKVRPSMVSCCASWHSAGAVATP